MAPIVPQQTTTAEPAPLTTDPAPAAGERTPPTQDPAPADDGPAPPTTDPAPVIAEPLTTDPAPAAVEPAKINPGFTPVYLKTRELSNSVQAIVAANVKLSDQAKTLMARMYDRFRARLGPVLASQDFDNLNMSFWIGFISDMMSLAKDFKVSGMEKKEIILETITLVIENEVPPEKRQAVNALVTTVVSPSIDLAIYYMNTIQPKCRSLLSRCSCR